MTTITEFLTLASKLIPEFDDSIENLQRFIDALNIVDSIKGEHEVTAVQLIKTKLKGTARNRITTETTIKDIIDKLKLTVKGESVEVIQAKLLNTKQQAKTANAFTNEIDELAKSLENAYISDGLTQELAKKYATKTAIQAMAKNTNNEKTRLVMESGNFTEMNEAISKFININNSNNQASVLYYNNRNQRFQNFNRRGRGRGYNYNNSFQRRPQQYYNNGFNGNRNNFNNNRGNNNNRGQSFNRPNNNNNNYNSNYQRNANIRYTNNTQTENEENPQRMRLGEI